MSEESMKARGSENKNEWGTVFRDREHPSVCHHESSVTSTHTRGQCTSREREREREREIYAVSGYGCDFCCSVYK